MHPSAEAEGRGVWRWAVGRSWGTGGGAADGRDVPSALSHSAPHTAFLCDWGHLGVLGGARPSWVPALSRNGETGTTSDEDPIAGAASGPQALILLGCKDTHLHGAEEQFTIIWLKESP